MKLRLTQTSPKKFATFTSIFLFFICSISLLIFIGLEFFQYYTAYGEILQGFMLSELISFIFFMYVIIFLLCALNYGLTWISTQIAYRLLFEQEDQAFKRILAVASLPDKQVTEAIDDEFRQGNVDVDTSIRWLQAFSSMKGGSKAD